MLRVRDRFRERGGRFVAVQLGAVPASRRGDERETAGRQARRIAGGGRAACGLGGARGRGVRRAVSGDRVDLHASALHGRRAPGQDHGAFGAFGRGDRKRNRAVAAAPPVHGYFTERRLVGGLDPVDAGKEVRLHGESPESGRNALYADERRIEPVHDVGHHEVVARRAVAGVPGFVARGVALCDHVAVAGLFRIDRHVVYYAGASVLRERLQEERIADFAGRHGIAAPADVLDYVVDDRAGLGGVGQAGDYRHGVCGLRVVFVAMLCGIPPFGVERLADRLRLGAERGGVILFAQEVCALRERHGVHVVERGGREVGRSAAQRPARPGGLPVPVAQAGGRDVRAPLRVLRAPCDVAVVRNHVGVVAADERIVAGPFVLLPRDQDHRRAPFDGIAESAFEDGVFGRDVGAHAVFELRIRKVHARLGVEPVSRPPPADLLRVQVVLLLPAELFAVGAVGEHGLHVRALRPQADVVDAVEKRQGAFERAGARHVGRHHARGRRNELRQRAALRGRRRRDAHVAEAVVEERRLERFVLAGPGEREHAPHPAPAVRVPRRHFQRRHRAVALRYLGELHLDAAAAWAARDDPRHVGRVLPEVRYGRRGRLLHRAHRSADLLEAADERRFAQRPGGRLRGDGSENGGRVGGGVDVVAGVDVRPHDLRRRHLPIRRAGFHGAAHDQPERALASGEFGVEAPARVFDVVHAVAERYFERVDGAGLQHGVEDVVEARLRGARPSRQVEFVAAAERLPVQRRDVLAQTADRDWRGAVARGGEPQREARRGGLQRGRRGDPLRSGEKRFRGRVFREGSAVRGRGGRREREYP